MEISGNNAIYTSSDFLTNKNMIIERTSITADSTDTTPSAIDIGNDLTSDSVGLTFNISIFNNSDFLITLNPGTGFTLLPVSPIKLEHHTITVLKIEVVSLTECEIMAANRVDKATMYQSIVDSTGYGDYTSLSAAVNAGKKSIFIRSGIYFETSNINLPNNFQITGEDKASTILHFSNTNSGLVVDGGADIETAGTVSVTHNTQIVTGTGTTFTNLSANDYIRIGEAYHQIYSISNDTTLILMYSYQGPTQTDITYKATTFKTGTITNIALGFSTGSLIHLNKVINVSIHNVGIGMGSKGVYVQDSGQFLIYSSVTYNCSKSLHIENSEMFGLSEVLIKNNTEEGVYLDNCKDLLIDSLYIFDSGSDGLRIANGGENLQLTETISNYNYGHGIRSDSSGNVIIQTCITTNNGGSGIVSNGTGYDTIDGCISTDNAVDGFVLSDNTAVAGCIARNNVDGVKIANKCSIIGGLIDGNSGGGIVFTEAKDDCIITSSSVSDNGGTGINILGTDNIVSLNMAKGNTTAGITDGGTGTINVNNKT